MADFQRCVRVWREMVKGAWVKFAPEHSKGFEYMKARASDEASTRTIGANNYLNTFSLKVSLSSILLTVCH